MSASTSTAFSPIMSASSALLWIAAFPCTLSSDSAALAFRRFAAQMRTARTRGGGSSGGNGGSILAGTGLLVTLVGGGLLLNASLFNGES